LTPRERKAAWKDVSRHKQDSARATIGYESGKGFKKGQVLYNNLNDLTPRERKAASRGGSPPSLPPSPSPFQ
jgi:hypothetical protein